LSGRVTEVLAELEQGVPGAGDELLRIVYGELRRLAARAMRGQPPGHTLQSTALVHDAWLRLLGGRKQSWENRAHFLGASAKAMRSILVDMARARSARKRGGDRARITFREALHGRSESVEEVIAIHEALTKLETTDPEKSRIVELRFFGGLEMEEIARILDMPKRTVERRWEHARAWLFREISR
jgi:RNA polymerase sigma factor (TIGR02999 family)